MIRETGENHSPRLAACITLSLLIITFLISCGGHLHSYRVPTKYKTPTCSRYYYAGECWTRYYGAMLIGHRTKWSVDPKMGKLVKIPISPLPRMTELRDRAYKILRESPKDAPLAEIYLVYWSLKKDLERTQQGYNKGENGLIRTRRQ